MTRIIVASKRPVWIALILSMLIHTGLISVEAGHRIDTSFLRAWILDSLAPMEKLVDRSLNGVTYIWGNYFALIGLHQENESLRTQIQTLQMRLDREREEVLEAKRLRELLSIQNSELGKSVVARVIGSDPAHGNQTVTIDKGLSHGVKPNSAVITPNGIVGRVIHSSNFFSIVQLILDSQSGIGVLLESTRRQGIIRGTGGNDLELDYIDDDTDLKEGDAFITSGLDRIYPKGLRVGVIASVGPRRGLFKSVQIRPTADFGRLEEVLCIIDPPQNVDAIDPTQASPSP
jgi:rod shape-determining protein MreC